MYRIIGYYSFGRKNDKIIKKIKDIFEKNSPNENFLPNEVNFLSFEQNKIFIDYQMIANKTAKNFYYIDKADKSACFITGNIFTFEKQDKIPLSGINIAEFVMSQHRQHGLDFLKHLRGEFNIILVKKDQVYLINDRLGLSPMYIYKIEDGILFCNTAEYLIWSNANNRLDHMSIAEFLVYGFVPDGKTFILNLANQKPGSIIKVSKKHLKEKIYSSFKKQNDGSLAYSKKLKLLKNAFNEAVSVRVPAKECYSSLTGGWDTRFILANLLKLKKKVFVYTAKTTKEDTAISKLITGTLGIRHILHHSTPVHETEMINERFRFKLRKNTATTNYKRTRDTEIRERLLTTPRLEGIFGTELLGPIPEVFLKRIALKFNDIASSIFEDNFLHLLRRNKRIKPWSNNSKGEHCNFIPHTFLTQVGRSYLNICYASYWERPTRFFRYLSLLPFADSNFLNCLTLLKYPEDFRYKTYQEIYKRYFPEFLKFPWTYSRHRMKYDLAKTKAFSFITNEEEQHYIDLMRTNKKFRFFLAKNMIIRKNRSSIFLRLKELYFLYEWTEAHKGIIAKDNLDILWKN